MDPYTSLLESSRGIIAKEGHLVVCTGAPVRVSYTVGLTPQLGYEVFVVGLSPQGGMDILNTLAGRLRTAEEPDDEPLHELANMALKLRFLPSAATAEAVSRLRMIPALDYAPVRIRQLLLPDTSGRFPGEPGYDLPFRQTLDDGDL